MEKESVAQENGSSSSKFLGTEKIGKLLCRFAIPCVLSLVIQALYNIVDQIYIGNTAGLAEFGNTATGIVYPLTVIALALGLWLGDGAAACISLNQGRNSTKDTHKSIGTAISVGLIVSVALVAISFVFKDSILVAFGASETILPFASEYATFIIIGFPFFILACVLNPIIRADGSPIYAMLSMVIGAVINIVLDPIFLWVCNMGMQGAALATCIAQIVTFLISAAYFFKSKSFRLKLSSFLPKWKFLVEELKLGISSCLTQLAIVIISIVNNNILVSFMSEDQSAIGLLAIAFKVYGIVISVAIGIASGGQPIIGYNYGAKNFDRVKKTLKYLLITTAIVGAVAMIFFIFAPSLIIKAFGYSNPSEFGINTFRIYLSFILLTCLTKVISIFFQAVGKPVKATIIAMVRDVIALVPLSLIFVYAGGIDLFLWSAPVSDVITLVLAVAFLVPFVRSLSKATATEPKENVQIQTARAGRIVTISRQHGAGGREIAIALAKALDVPFYDKEIASIVAKDSGLSAEFVGSIDEGKTDFNSLYLGTQASVMAIKAQTEVLKKIANQGSCVILGRAADFVLEEFDPFTIFIYADEDYKKQRIMKNYGDDEKSALANMEKSDKRRAKFYHDFSGKEWGKRENYDLCIDSSIGTQKTVEVILEYLKDEKQQTVEGSQPADVKI